MDKIVRGIVLKTIDYKENDKKLTILTLQEGKIQVTARGAKKANSKLKAFCQSFCFADFELTQGKAGYILTGVRSIDTFFDLTSDYDKFSYAISILEILDKICIENQVYDELFFNALICIKDICYSQIEPRLLLCKFLVYVLSSEGYDFNLNECSNCKKPLKSEKFLNLSSGEIVCSECKGGDFVQVENGVFSTLKIVSQNSYDNLNTIKISKKILDKTLFLLIKNFSNRYEMTLNSLKF